jgi:alpha-mannosidase
VADRGHHRFVYRLLPHSGDLRAGGVVDAGYDLNVALRSITMSPHPGTRPPSGSLLSVDADNVVVEVVKESDDGTGALVVRLYEAWGQRGPVALRAPWALSSATRTDLLERPVDEASVQGATVTLDMTPFQIVTLKLSRAGA